MKAWLSGSIFNNAALQPEIHRTLARAKSTAFVRSYKSGEAVMHLSTPSGIKGESDHLFWLLYDRAVTSRNHIVDTYFLQSQQLKFSLMDHLNGWEKSGWGRVIEEKNDYGEHWIQFAVSEAGVKHGERLVAQLRRRSFTHRIRRDLWPALNGIAALIAAIAAIAAAYFSYLGLQR
jgi:hypothetical protein